MFNKNSMLQKGVFMTVNYTPGQIVSSISLRPKKEGSHSFILNLKSLNELVTHHHFKMGSLHTVTNLVTKNCFMDSTELKNAYYSIPIRTDDQKF